MKTILKSLWKDEDGASAVEYGLIAGLIAAVLVTAIGFLTTGLTNVFTSIGTTLTNAL